MSRHRGGGKRRERNALLRTSENNEEFAAGKIDRVAGCRYLSV